MSVGSLILKYRNSRSIPSNQSSHALPVVIWSSSGVNGLVLLRNLKVSSFGNYSYGRLPSVCYCFPFIDRHGTCLSLLSAVLPNDFAIQYESSLALPFGSTFPSSSPMLRPQSIAYTHRPCS